DNVIQVVAAPKGYAARPLLRRSASALTLNNLKEKEEEEKAMTTPLLSFGRSRDSKLWEMYCDHDIRSTISMAPITQQQNHPHSHHQRIQSQLASPSTPTPATTSRTPKPRGGRKKLQRASTINTASLLKRRALAPRNGNNQDPAVSVEGPNKKRSRLSRASSSLARLENTNSNSLMSNKTVTNSMKPSRRGQDSDFLQYSGGDSDKENWEPGFRIGSSLSLSSSSYHAARNDSRGATYDRFPHLPRHKEDAEDAEEEEVGEPDGGDTHRQVSQSSRTTEICKGTDTVIHGFERPHMVVGRDGKMLPMTVTDRILTTLWMLIDETMDWSLKNTKAIPAELNAFDHLKKRINESSGYSTTEKDCSLELSKLWGSYIGSPVDRQSLKYFFIELGNEGSNLFVVSTHGKVLRHISKAVLATAQVLLNETVVSVTTLHSEGIRKTFITTSLDKQFEDGIVATFPLGYGALEKIYVRFPSAFWHIKKEDATVNETEQRHPIEFVDFLNPSYTTMPARSQFWNQECISLSLLPEPRGQPTLLFYLCGPSADYITSYVASLDPDSTEYFRWFNDEFSGHGSYTNFQVGLKGGSEHVNAFSDDALGTARGIWFAGEHTAPLLGLGTTAGAYWSGEITARRICKHFDRN
ncbi:hypothetical protein KEM54_000678, partial [Ascosphaera aggregata]